MSFSLADFLKARSRQLSRSIRPISCFILATCSLFFSASIAAALTRGRPKGSAQRMAGRAATGEDSEITGDSDFAAVIPVERPELAWKMSSVDSPAEAEDGGRARFAARGLGPGSCRAYLSVRLTIPTPRAQAAGAVEDEEPAKCASCLFSRLFTPTLSRFSTNRAEAK